MGGFLPIVRYAFYMALVIALAGCGGTTSAINGTLPQGITRSSYATDGGSWMDAGAKIKKLLYISVNNSSAVDIFDYKTGAFVGKLGDFAQPSGQCVDAAGDIWITDYSGQDVAEYYHGRRQRVKRRDTDGSPQSCSIDPTTGNLAVMNSSTPSGPGNVVVFTSSGKLTYSNSNCAYNAQIGYDIQGNLYLPGSTTDSTHVCVLLHGATSIETASVNQEIYAPAGVMWDGKYITFADYNYDQAGESAIYQFSENTSGGLTLLGTTVLNNPCGDKQVVPFYQPFIVGTANTPVNKTQGNAVVSEDCLSDFSLWSYPSGGNQEKSLSNPPYEVGESVSLTTH